MLKRCADVQLLESSQAEFDHPDWLANAKHPVSIGGHIGFVVAYCLVLYTIFHVARAHKKLEFKVCGPLQYYHTTCEGIVLGLKHVIRSVLCESMPFLTTEAP